MVPKIAENTSDALKNKLTYILGLIGNLFETAYMMSAIMITYYFYCIN